MTVSPLTALMLDQVCMLIAMQKKRKIADGESLGREFLYTNYCHMPGDFGKGWGTANVFGE
jgi:hypothetical protein